MNHDPRTCETCDSSFLPLYRVTAAYWAGRRFCSKECAVAGMHGEPRSTRGVARVPFEQRFWSKVDRRGLDECWEWTGAREVAGYGFLLARVGSAKRWEKAHRLSWEIHNGPIDDDLSVLHHCDNPPCVNPAHLFLGTRGDNNRDRSAKGRSSRRPVTSKLSSAQVQEIRQLVASGLTQLVVAEQFGINQTHVSRIVRGESWRT